MDNIPNKIKIKEIVFVIVSLVIGVFIALYFFPDTKNIDTKISNIPYKVNQLDRIESKLDNLLNEFHKEDSISNKKNITDNDSL